MKGAFTITELLVVTAIIGVLAAVLFPVLSAQPRSIAACLSNENQLISGVELYAANYDDHVLPWISCSAAQCIPGPRFDVDRIWTSRLKPYVSSPLDPETGDPYFPPSAPYRCPDWNLSRLTAGADANDCDGPGAIEGVTPFVLGRHMRSELFSTYGLVFGMCSYQEVQSGLPACMSNGGTFADARTYGRGGTTANDAMFTFAGDGL